MIKMLRELKAAFERHSSHYMQDEDDDVWIPDVTRRGWIIISGDKGIENDGINRQAVIDSKAKVFVLSDTNSRGIEWAASLVLAHKRIIEIAEKNDGPFYCTVNKGSASHVDGDLRFHGTGGPKNAPTTSVVQEPRSQGRLKFGS